MRGILLAMAMFLLVGCSRTTGRYAACDPLPPHGALSKTSTEALWSLVDNYRLCPGDDNFSKEEVALLELVRRKDPRATYELGSEYKTGFIDREAEGDRLVHASAELGYAPAKNELRSGGH